MDVTDIEAGVDFVDVLQDAVGSCDVLLAVMGREWLTCTDRNSRRRLDDPHDFIRLEIGTALTRKVRVIPVLVEGAVMPTASELPSDLEALTRRQAVELRDARWNADVESLTGVLDRVLVPRTAGSESTPSQPRHAALWGLAAVALISVLVAVVTLVPRGGSTPSGPAPQGVSGTSVSSGPRAGVDRPRAIEQPTRTPAPTLPPPAPASVSPGRAVPADVGPSGPLPSTTPVNGGSGTLGTVLVYYAADDDYKTAADLAFALRKSINDPRYVVRTLKTARGIGGEGEVRYSSSGLSTLTEALAKNAGSWLSRTYGRRVAFTPTVDPRVTATGVIVILPGRASAPAVPPDPVVTIVYPAAGDPKMAEDLANFLRTLRSGWKYSVQTVRATTGPRKEGQIDYDNERMAALAQVLARDPAAWLSRAYGRRVVLQPTMSGKIGANTVVFWLPSR